MKPIKAIIDDAISQSMSYQEYVDLMSSLTELGKATGPNQTESLVNYTKLNNQRMKRLAKTIVPDESTKSALANISNPQTWLIITESWCGDAAQVLPILQNMAEINNHIDIRLVLRDENLTLMDEFLFSGGRSIPKLIVLDENHEILGSWGPRPQEAQMLFDNWKKEENPRPYTEFSVELQKWYLKDKGQSTFGEVIEMIEQFSEKVMK